MNEFFKVPGLLHMTMASLKTSHSILKMENSATKKNAISTSKVYLFSPKILRNFSLVKAMQDLLTRVSLFSFFAFTSSTTTLSISMSELWVTSSVMSTIFKLQQKLYMYYDIFLRDISISYLCERLDFTGSSTFKMYVVLGHIHGYQKSKQSITEMNKNKKMFFSLGFLFVLAR